MGSLSIYSPRARSRVALQRAVAACSLVAMLVLGAAAPGASAAPIIGELQLSHAAISPDGNRLADDTELVLSVRDAAWVRTSVVDDTGATVRTLWDAEVAPGPMLLMWDGRTDDGTRLADGRYRARVEAWAVGDPHVNDVREPQGTPQLALERTVDIDTRPPGLTLPTRSWRHRAGVRTLDLPLRVGEESLVEVRVFERGARRDEPLALALPVGHQRATVRTADHLYRRRTAGSYRIELVASDAAWNVTRRSILVRTVADPLGPPPGWTGGGTEGGKLPRWLRPIMLRATRAAGVPASWASSPALAQLILHESSFNPRAQNPTSTAYGLFQFLDQTWAGTRGRKTSDPYLQSVYGLRYIKNRYRTPERAWAFWQAQSPHWYSLRDEPSPAALSSLALRRIDELELSHASISPDGDGRADAVDVVPRMRLGSSADLLVLDPAGVPLRTLWSGPLPDGATTLSWDGRDEAGARVPDGTYLIVARARSGDAAATEPAEEATATVRVDTTAPRAARPGARVRARGGALLRVPLLLEEEASVTLRVRDGRRTRELSFLQPTGASTIELRAPRTWQVARRAGRGTVEVLAVDAAWNSSRSVLPVDIVPAPVAPAPWGGGELLMPTSGPITSAFGPRWGRMHEGIDIGAPSGTPIRAAAGGRVAYSGWLGGYGNVIYLDHGNGLTTRYGHQSTLRVRGGQLVRRGQHIGDVGSTGRSTGPHLHFEVRRNGVARNPIYYL